MQYIDYVPDAYPEEVFQGDPAQVPDSLSAPRHAQSDEDDDDFVALVGARLKTGPRPGASSIALAEPDESAIL